jgi:multisubunit Na+/H+ antiporter MnhB subunit
MTGTIHIDWRFMKWVAFSYAGSAVLIYYPVSQFATPEILRGIIAGGVMCLINLLIGYAVIEKAFESSHTKFIKYVLGGMGGRLFLMWGVLILLLKQFHFHSASLMLSLLFFYILTLALEIFYLQKRTSTKQ